MVFETPENFHPSNEPKNPSKEALFFLIKGNEVATISTDETINIPYFKQIENTDMNLISQHFLGMLGKTPCYTGEVAPENTISSKIHWFGLRALFGRLDDSIFSLAGRSLQIIDWDRSNLFCGRCGENTILGEKEKVRLCPKCQQRHYPKISPAVMALVGRGKDFLLARSPHFPPGMFSALAGFTEPGETLEQTIHREVLEEVGIKVGNIRYFSSQ